MQDKCKKCEKKYPGGAGEWSPAGKIKAIGKEAEKLRAKKRSLEKENENLKFAMEQSEIEMLHLL
mgnify:CR=1